MIRAKILRFSLTLPCSQVRIRLMAMALLCVWLLSFLSGCASEVAPSSSLGVDNLSDSYFSKENLPLWQNLTEEMMAGPTYIMGDTVYSAAFQVISGGENNQDKIQIANRLEAYNIKTTQGFSVDLSEDIGAKSYIAYLAGVGQDQLYVFSISLSSNSNVDLRLTILEAGTGKVLTPTYSIPLPMNFSVISLVVDQEGHLFCGTTGQVYMTDLTGQKQNLIDAPDFAGYLYAIAGKIYGLQMDNTDSSKPFRLAALSFGAGKFSKPILLDTENITASSLGENSFYSASIALGANTEQGAFAFDLKTGQCKELLQWSNCAMDSSSGQNCRLMLSSEPEIIGIIDNSGLPLSSDSAFLLRPSAGKPQQNKEIITLGGLGLGFDKQLQTAVILFNQQSDQYYIEVKDYSKDFVYGGADSPKAWIDCVQQMNLDILSSTAPDIIYEAPNGLLDIYESKGLLLDLSDLTKDDCCLSASRYLPSILALTTSDSGIYRASAGFMLTGLVGSQRLLDGASGWTFADFDRWAAELPTGVNALSYQEQSGTMLLEDILQTDLITYVDYKNNQAHLDTPDFKALLTFVRTQSSKTPKIDSMSYEQIQNHEAALINTYIEFPFIYRELLYLFDEPITGIGFPSSRAKSMSAKVMQTLSVMNKTKYPQACLEFIDIFLSEKVQVQNIDRYISTVQPILDQQVKNAMKADYTYSGATITMNTKTPPLNAEQAKDFYDLLAQIDGIYSDDYTCIDILTEEAAPYFQGSKSAEEVTKIMQNRVSNLLAELK